MSDMELEREEDGFNPLTLGDTPEEYIENEDGSVTIPEMEESMVDETEFYANLAEVLSEHELRELAGDYLDLIEKDKDSRKKRDELYEDGLRRTGLGEDAPGGAQFDGASKVVHPVLAESCVDFAARAIKELFPATGPVKTYILGDAPSEVIDRAERKRQYLNWQFTNQIKGYREELEQLLTQLPLGGSQYQKFWYNERFNRPSSEFVPIDELYLPFAASNFYDAQRVTHVQYVTKQEFKRRIKSGLYRDIQATDPSEYPEFSAASVANDKIEGREEDAYNEDGLRTIYEVYTWLEIDDPITGEESAPYILTIDVHTEKVLSIYRNWEEGDKSFEKLDWIVEWKFIPWRGAYAIGLPHLIGGLSAAATGALRALLDSAHIQNAPTLIKLKGGRVVGQNVNINMTEVTEIDAPPNVDDIRKIIMQAPFPGPSPTLFQLLGFLGESAKGVVTTAEEKIASVGDRTPVGTTQSLIEQGSVVYSAIHARLHESHKKAIQIVCRLNKQYLSDHEEVEDLGKLVVSREDFIRSNDIIPVSDPAIFSETQRFAQTQSLLQMAAQDAQNPNIQWNQVAIRRRMLKQMRIEGIDELLPEPKKPVTADPLTENSTVMKGVPIQAAPQQDHMAHIQGHLAFVSSPLQLQNPLVQPQPLLAILAHIQQHIQMYQEVVIGSMVQQVVIQAQSQGQVLSPDAAVALAVQQAQPLLMQQLGQYIQQIAQLQQELQKRVPPPPMPPEVQATLQIAQMENQRKTQLDQASLQMDQQKMTIEQQVEAQRLQMEAAQQQFDMQQEAMRTQFEQYAAQQQQAIDAQAAQMQEQLKVFMNEQDNKQHQMTELLKNADDNRTQLMIAKMREEIGAMMSSRDTESSSQTDLGPQLQQLTSTLDQLGKQQTNDALASVMDGLRATIQSLNKPKTVVRDQQNRIIGVQ